MAERRLTGLALKVGPLGEHDRLLSLLSDAEGVSRFAVPGARRPKSSLAAAAPLTLLELQVGGRSGLARVRQLRVLRSFSGLGQQLETLAAAQALCDLCLQLAAQDPVDGLLDTMQLRRGFRRLAAAAVGGRHRRWRRHGRRKHFWGRPSQRQPRRRRDSGRHLSGDSHADGADGRGNPESPRRAAIAPTTWRCHGRELFSSEPQQCVDQGQNTS